MLFRLSRYATHVAYGATQAPRVAWYLGHSLLLRELAENSQKRGATTQTPHPRRHLGAR
jgi:hypothetical protein